MLHQDIWIHIIINAPDGATFKSFILTCKHNHDVICLPRPDSKLEILGQRKSMLYWRLVERYSDHRSTRAKFFGPHIALHERDIHHKVIEDSPSFHWRWTHVSQNKHLSLDFITKHYIRLNKRSLSNNVNLTIDFLRNHCDDDWIWHNLTINPAFTLKMIEDNQDLPWVRDSIFRNPNLTLQEALAHIPFDVPHLPRKVPDDIILRELIQSSSYSSLRQYLSMSVLMDLVYLIIFSYILPLFLKISVHV